MNFQPEEQQMTEQEFDMFIRKTAKQNKININTLKNHLETDDERRKRLIIERMKKKNDPYGFKELLNNK